MRMKKTAFFLIPFIILAVLVTAGTSLKDEDVDIAYQNAKKGMYWGLSHLKSMKTKLDEKLINDNSLTARVKVEKEINGVSITSIGYDGSTEVTITVYRTYESLLKDGYVGENFGKDKYQEK